RSACRSGGDRAARRLRRPGTDARRPRPDLARRGEHNKADQLVREAVAMVARTDNIVLHGDALLALAEVQGASGSKSRRTRFGGHSSSSNARRTSSKQSRPGPASHNSRPVRQYWTNRAPPDLVLDKGGVCGQTREPRYALSRRGARAGAAALGAGLA